ncbi:MAG: hypothetical protein V1911_00690 [Candidatus Micrarchaeota archaeon]
MEGMRGSGVRQRHRIRKRYKAFPEEARITKGKMKTGGEASNIDWRKAPTRRGVVTKTYQIGKDRTVSNKITWGEMINRFKFQKELSSRGLPIVKPLKIERSGDKIYWTEELIEGPTYDEVIEREKENHKKLAEIEGEFAKSKEKVVSFVKEQKTETPVNNRTLLSLLAKHLAPFGDYAGKNAIWDSRRKKFFFTDIYVYRPKH